MSKDLKFENRVKEHMGNYKKNILGVMEQGVYIHNNKIYSYNHILPIENKTLNILEDYRDDFYSSDFTKDLKFHKYFHHLNSSQAMGINFFYPLIKENKIEVILDILGISFVNNDSVVEMGFEKESELGDGLSRRTNFDFYIKLSSGIKVFFEIKYTENGFGKAVIDKRHIENYNRIYKSLLANCEAIKQEYNNQNFFLNNYQIMRNILHINDNNYVVILYPKDNRSIGDKGFEILKTVIEKEYSNHLILYAWEEIVNELVMRLTSNKLINYYRNEFYYKYLDY